MPILPEDWFHNVDIEDFLALAVGIAISLGILVFVLVVVFSTLNHFLGLPFLVTAALTLVPTLAITAGVLWVLGNSSSTSWSCSIVVLALFVILPSSVAGAGLLLFLLSTTRT